MPCNSSHMEPRHAEKDSQEAAALIVYVYDSVGLVAPQDAVLAANDCYGNESKLNDYVVKLCSLCSDMSTKELDEIMYDGRNPDARKLADWWESHKAADVDREKSEGDAKRKTTIIETVTDLSRLLNWNMNGMLSRGWLNSSRFCLRFSKLSRVASSAGT